MSARRGPRPLIRAAAGDHGGPLHYDQAMASATTETARRRVPATERRDELIDAAIAEFAHSGLHGTPVDRIARRVGVAQPYVFSLFPSKRDLFIAAVERGFDRVGETFTRAVAELHAATAAPAAEAVSSDDLLKAMADGYMELLASERDLLMLQHQAYAACDDETIREHVRAAYAALIAHIAELSGAGPDQIDEFMSRGMWLNVLAAMGVEDLAAGCEWMRTAPSPPADRPDS